MSKYSTEVAGLINTGIEKIIRELSARLGDYGELTYDSEDVTGWRNALSYYTSLANFLDEYVDGDEEIDFDDLYTVIKIALSSVKAGSSSVETYSSTAGSPVESTELITLTINGATHPESTPFYVAENEIISLQATYNGSAVLGSTQLTVDTLSITEASNVVSLNNYKVNFVGLATKLVTVTVFFKTDPNPVSKLFYLRIIPDATNIVPDGFIYTFPFQLF